MPPAKSSTGSLGEQVAGEADRARWSFSRLLEWHLKHGTRPDCSPDLPGRRWTYQEFADQNGIGTLTLYHWRAGRRGPSSLRGPEQVLFGDNPAYDEWRQELRAAYYATKRGRRGASAESPVNFPYTGQVFPPSVLVGRAMEMDRLTRALLVPKPRVLLLGSSGIGKTTLARAVVSSQVLVDRFNERRWLVSLEAVTDADKLRTAIATALGLDLFQSALDSALALLGGLPALIVLDGLEVPYERDRLATQDVVRRLSEVPNIALLATMRGNSSRPKILWSYESEIGPLTEDEAHRLFLTLAPGVKRDDPYLHPLLQILGGQPSAIETIALRAAAHESLAALWRALRREKEARDQPGTDAVEQPVVPASKPAALEPVWTSDRLALPIGPAQADLAAEHLTATVAVLRAELLELASDAQEEANADRRATAYIRRIAERIPTENLSQIDVFCLAHMQEILVGYARKVNAEWSDFLAERYHAVVLHFGRVVRQFPAFREFLHNAAEAKLSAEQASQVSELAEIYVAAMRDEEGSQYVDSTIPGALEELQQPLRSHLSGEQSIPLSEESGGHLAEDILESVSNILKKIAEVAISTTRPSAVIVRSLSSVVEEASDEFASAARTSLIKEAKSLGASFGPGLRSWSRRVIVGTALLSAGKFGGVPLTVWMMETYPATFKWLEPIVSHLLPH